MLREKDFITEVHSINGEGEDEGVVYSEMESLVARWRLFSMERALTYPPFHVQALLHLTLPTLVVTLRTSGS